jgi:hypothetical protein
MSASLGDNQTASPGIGMATIAPFAFHHYPARALTAHRPHNETQWFLPDRVPGPSADTSGAHRVDPFVESTK